MSDRAVFARLRALIGLQTSHAQTGNQRWQHPTHLVDCDTRRSHWFLWGDAVDNRGTKPDAVIPFEAIELMYDHQTAAVSEADAHYQAMMVKAARVILDALAATNGEFRHGPTWDLDHAVQYFEGKASSAEPADDVPIEETETQGSDT